MKPAFGGDPGVIGAPKVRRLRSAYRLPGEPASLNAAIRGKRPKRRSVKRTSILEGADAAVDRWLGLGTAGRPGRYKLKGAARQVRGRLRAHRGIDGLISVLLCIMGRNFEEARYDRPWEPSRENWRLLRRENLPEDPRREPEATLERRIVRLQRGRWANQVPIASGLCGPNSDKRRCIDLVRRGLEPGSFTFYELKWRSDSPLCAAMQVLQYGAAYLFTRFLLDDPADSFERRELLEAERIRLRTLAPLRFYGGADLRWLQESLRHGLARFLDDTPELRLEMDFAFETFPKGIRWKDDPGGVPDSELLMALDGRHLVYA